MITRVTFNSTAGDLEWGDYEVYVKCIRQSIEIALFDNIEEFQIRWSKLVP